MLLCSPLYDSKAVAVFPEYSHMSVYSLRIDDLVGYRSSYIVVTYERAMWADKGR